MTRGDWQQDGVAIGSEKLREMVEGGCVLPDRAAMGTQKRGNSLRGVEV